MENEYQHTMREVKSNVGGQDPNNDARVTSYKKLGVRVRTGAKYVTGA